ncbi:MAG: hypothetical protein OJF51_001392 [Nitrospira sp.]|nr:MAG: hypothetical protein OJF51_001392 [Nitrospira sp.]
MDEPWRQAGTDDEIVGHSLLFASLEFRHRAVAVLTDGQPIECCGKHWRD